jgi:hypothetical protein
VKSRQILISYPLLHFLEQMIRGFLDPVDVLLVHRIVRDILKRIPEAPELFDDLGLDPAVSQPLIQVQNRFHAALDPQSKIFPALLVQKPFKDHDSSDHEHARSIAPKRHGARTEEHERRSQYSPLFSSSSANTL